MPSIISGNYSPVAPADLDAIAVKYDHAWQDRDLPRRQYEMIVKGELEGYAQGIPVAPYDALARCLRQLPSDLHTLLDVGGGPGHYREVLRIAGFDFKYTGVDYSQASVDFGRQLYFGIDLDIADARNLPYHDSMFDIVTCGATLMHVREYAQVIKECARVAAKYVIFHRTPLSAQTEYWTKEAYGVPCLEMKFTEAELFDLFKANGLTLIYQTDVFPHNRNYVLAVPEGLRHVQV